VSDIFIHSPGYDEDDLSALEAGAWGSDEDANDPDFDEYVIEDEAGIIEFIIPAVAAAEAKKRGRKFKGGSRGSRSRKTGRGRARKGWARSIRRRLGSISRGLRDLSSRVATLERGSASLSAKGGAVVATGGDPMGARPILSATLALGGAGPGLTPWGGVLTINPTNMSVISTAIISVLEDAPAAAAGQNPVGPSSPFVITQATLAGANLMRSAAPSAPGEMFGVSGSQYGYPLGTGRSVTVPPSAPITFVGSWSPRTSGGAAGGDVNAALLSPRVAA